MLRGSKALLKFDLDPIRAAIAHKLEDAGDALEIGSLPRKPNTPLELRDSRSATPIPLRGMTAGRCLAPP